MAGMSCTRGTAVALRCVPRPMQQDQKRTVQARCGQRKGSAHGARLAGDSQAQEGQTLKRESEGMSHASAHSSKRTGTHPAEFEAPSGGLSPVYSSAVSAYIQPSSVQEFV